MNEMIEKFHSTYPLHDLVKSDLAKVIKHGTVKKGEYLFTAGMISEHFYFVTKGLLRCYYIREHDGRVITTHLIKEGEFFTLHQNMFFDPVEGKENLHALEDTSYCYMLYTDFPVMLDRHQDLNRAVVYLGVEYHERQTDANLTMLQCSPEAKRRWLEEKHPELVKRVPQPYLANFLGIDLKTMRDLDS